MILASEIIELLSSFTTAQIIIFIVLLAISFKKIADFLDWMRDKIKKRDNKHQETISRDQKIDQQLIEFQSELEVKILKESDKDDIKAFITREHHYFCYTKGWIDDFSMDCIEKRYAHYVEEEGNSFVLDLMTELRALPKQEPKIDKGAN